MLDVLNVKVYDLAGNDIITNLVTLTMDKEDGTFSYLTGEVYTIEILSKIKDTVNNEDIAEFINGNGISNEGRFNFRDGCSLITSNKPTVTPPPQDLKIDKKFNGVNHIYLVNDGELSTWELSSAFGTLTNDCKSVNIEPVLDILAVRIYVIAGNDITDTTNGTLNVYHSTNTITLDLDK